MTKKRGFVSSKRAGLTKVDKAVYDAERYNRYKIASKSNLLVPAKLLRDFITCFPNVNTIHVETIKNRVYFLIERLQKNNKIYSIVQKELINREIDCLKKILSIVKDYHSLTRIKKTLRRDRKTDVVLNEFYSIKKVA